MEDKTTRSNQPSNPPLDESCSNEERDVNEQSGSAQNEQLSDERLSEVSGGREGLPGRLEPLDNSTIDRTKLASDFRESRPQRLDSKVQ